MLKTNKAPFVDVNYSVKHMKHKVYFIITWEGGRAEAGEETRIDKYEGFFLKSISTNFMYLTLFYNF